MLVAVGGVFLALVVAVSTVAAALLIARRRRVRREKRDHVTELVSSRETGDVSSGGGNVCLKRDGKYTPVQKKSGQGKDTTVATSDGVFGTPNKEGVATDKDAVAVKATGEDSVSGEGKVTATTPGDEKAGGREFATATAAESPTDEDENASEEKDVSMETSGQEGAAIATKTNVAYLPIPQGDDGGTKEAKYVELPHHAKSSVPHSGGQRSQSAAATAHSGGGQRSKRAGAIATAPNAAYGLTKGERGQLSEEPVYELVVESGESERDRRRARRVFTFPKRSRTQTTPTDTPPRLPPFHPSRDSMPRQNKTLPKATPTTSHRPLTGRRAPKALPPGGGVAKSSPEEENAYELVNTADY
jgi:hypothetical protein